MILNGLKVEIIKLIQFLKFFLLSIILFHSYIIQISNGFVTDETIAKSLRDDLDVNVHPRTVQKARHEFLNYNYRRSKCKPKKDYNDRENNLR